MRIESSCYRSWTLWDLGKSGQVRLDGVSQQEVSQFLLKALL